MCDKLRYRILEYDCVSYICIDQDLIKFTQTFASNPKDMYKKKKQRKREKNHFYLTLHDRTKETTHNEWQ